MSPTQMAVVVVGWAWLSLPLAVVIHEAGHAIAARSVGLKVASVGIGHGRTLAVRVFGCRLFIGRRGLLSGLTFMLPRRWGLGRWRNVVAILGGPMANLLAAAGGLHAGGPFGVVFTLMNLVAGVGNLVPYTRTTAGGMIPTDGLLAWQVVRTPPALAHSPAAARQVGEVCRAVGEPRAAAYLWDLSAIAWHWLGATDAAARAVSAAEANRHPAAGRVEQVVALLARAAVGPPGDRETARVKAVREAGADARLAAFAEAVLGNGFDPNPWCRARRLRKQATNVDAATAVELLAEAVRLAYEPNVHLSAHPDDAPSFAAAVHELVEAHGRAVTASGGDPVAAKDALLAPVHAQIQDVMARVAAGKPDPAADRRRWWAGVRLAGGQLLFGGALLGVLFVVPGRNSPVVLKAFLLAGFAAAKWAVVPLSAAAGFALLPGNRLGRGDSGRTMHRLAVAAAVMAGLLAPATHPLAFGR